MKLHFDDPSFSFELLRNIGYAVSCGADIGECLSTAARIAEGDYESWFREWAATGERLRTIADAALAGGHRVSAREAYLRASTYFRMAVFYVRMTRAHDPDVRAAYRASVETFAAAARLLPGISPLRVPFEGRELRGYFFATASSAPRPTIVFVQGYDSTVEEVLFACADAATKRGYNVASVDGPGQGWALHEDGLTFRVDYETVVGAVVDAIVARPEVGPDRLVIEGFSLGVLLGARAAAFGGRAKALIQYNAVFDYGQSSLGMAGADAQAAWQAGDMLEAENDGFFGDPPQPVKMWEALHNAPKTLIKFTSQEGAEEHCQAGAYLLNAQRLFDWLDDTLTPSTITSGYRIRSADKEDKT